MTIFIDKDYEPERGLWTCGNYSNTMLIENYGGEATPVDQIITHRFLDDALALRDRFFQISQIPSNQQNLQAVRSTRLLVNKFVSDAEKLESSVCSDLAAEFNWHVTYLENVVESKTKDIQSSRIKIIAFAVAILAVAIMITFGVVVGNVWLPAAVAVYGICISAIMKAVETIRNRPKNEEEITYLEEEATKSLRKIQTIDLESLIMPKPEEIAEVEQVEEAAIEGLSPAPTSRVMNALYWVWEKTLAPCRVRRRHANKQLDN